MSTKSCCQIVLLASFLLGSWHSFAFGWQGPNPSRNPSREAQKAGSGSKTTQLVGRFVLDGELAKRKNINTNYRAYSPLKSLPEDALEETLIVGKDRGIANIFVYVRSNDIPFRKPREIREPAKINVVKGQFSPHTLVIQSPRKLQFTNTAESPINVRTQFWVNDNQNRVLPSGQSFDIALKAERVPVQYSCDIYPWMRGWILVTPHPYAAVSDASGAFAISGLPTGEWEFQVWHERVGSLKTADWPKGRFTRQIKAGKNDLGTIKLKPDLLEHR